MDPAIVRSACERRRRFGNDDGVNGTVSEITRPAGNLSLLRKLKARLNLPPNWGPMRADPMRRVKLQPVSCERPRAHRVTNVPSYGRRPLV